MFLWIYQQTWTLISGAKPLHAFQKTLLNLPTFHNVKHIGEELDNIISITFGLILYFILTDDYNCTMYLSDTKIFCFIFKLKY